MTTERGSALAQIARVDTTLHLLRADLVNAGDAFERGVTVARIDRALDERLVAMDDRDRGGRAEQTAAEGSSPAGAPTDQTGDQ